MSGEDVGCAHHRARLSGRPGSARGGYVPGSGSVVARLYDGERLIGSDGRVWKVVRK